jgi:nucleoid-associated protein YgaU
MKRDARIGLAVVLVVGLAITLLVARSIHQNGVQAGIDQDPEPKRETASANDAQPTDPGATLDPVYDAQAKAVMEFQTQHDYAAAPVEVTDNNPAGISVDVGANPIGATQNGGDRSRNLLAGNNQLPGNGAGILPPLGQPPVPVGAGSSNQQPVAANVLGSYTIAAGDNPWKISAKVFGDGKYAQKIMDANTGLNPSKLRVGQKINIPAIPNASARIALENTAGSSIGNPVPPIGGAGLLPDGTTGAGPVPPIGGTPVATAQTHTVLAGDTLGRIAAKYLGSSGPKTVKKLQDANPGLDAKRLKVGQEIKIPTP